MRAIVGSAVAVALAATLVACGSSSSGDSSSKDGVTKDEITWGLLSDITGPTASTQVPFASGFMSFFDQLNAAGGIHGRKIKVLQEDDKFDPALQKTIVERFLDQRPVIGMTGFGNSAGQQAIRPTIEEAGIPVIGTATMTAAALVPANPSWFNTQCPYRAMAEVGVQYMAESLGLDAPKVVVMNLDLPSGHEYAEDVKATVEKIGGTLVASITMATNATDLTPQLTELANSGADYIMFYGLGPHVKLLLNGLKQFDIKTPVMSIGAIISPSLFESLTPETGANFLFDFCITPPSAAPDLFADAKAAAEKLGVGKDWADPNFAHGWTVASMIADILDKVGDKPSRKAIVDFLNKGYSFDSGGQMAPISYSASDHQGTYIVRPYRWNFDTESFEAIGEYNDYVKYVTTPGPG